MKVFWTKTNFINYNEEFPDLFEDHEYSQRLQYLGDKQQNCTVRLSHVTGKDEMSTISDSQPIEINGLVNQE